MEKTLFCLAVTACTVGLSVGLPHVLDDSLKLLADTDLQLKGFYNALETHQFDKAGKLYDQIKANQEKLKAETNEIALSKPKIGITTGRFMRLAEVQMNILAEKVSSIINHEKDDGKTGHGPVRKGKKEESKRAKKNEKIGNKIKNENNNIKVEAKEALS